mgnify:CR=1 FL=1
MHRLLGTHGAHRAHRTLLGTRALAHLALGAHYGEGGCEDGHGGEDEHHALGWLLCVGGGACDGEVVGKEGVFIGHGQYKTFGSDGSMVTKVCLFRVSLMAGWPRWYGYKEVR